VRPRRDADLSPRSSAEVKNRVELYLYSPKGPLWPMTGLNLLDTTERFYIYNKTRKNNEINDKNTAKPNIIFETIIREDTSRAHTTA
jgi:hypothetical protein